MSEAPLLVPCKTLGCKNKVRPPEHTCKSCKIIANNMVERETTAQAKAKQALQIREATAKLKEKAGRKEQERAAIEIEQYDSVEDCGLDEVRGLLRERRNLTKDYVIEACYRQGLMAARQLKIIANRYFWTFGVLSALESLKQQSPVNVLPSVEDAKALNDQFRNQDRLALWDFSCSWREQDAREGLWDVGHRITYEEFESLRFLKGQPAAFGNLFFDTDFEELHREWEEFLPPIPMDLLPEKYTQKQFKIAMASLSDIREFLLTAFRSSFKSTYLRTWLLCFICCMPSVRVLCASSTTPLTLEVVKVMRAQFVVENDSPSLFQQIFADLCLYTKDDQGSVRTYECPARQLKGLAQPTLFSVGLDSTVAGRRFDILWADDVSDNTNSDNPDARASTWRKWTLMKELREGAGASLIILSGTPYSRGDLLETAINMNAVSTEKTLAVRMDPAFEILDEARRRELAEKPQLYYQLQENEVRMRFPKQFSWKEFRAALASAELKEILQQKLLIWTADGEIIPLNFERETFDKCLVEKAPERTAETQVILGLDRAYSTQKFADRSSIAAVMIHKNADDMPAGCVLDVRANRWKTSELATAVVDAYILHKPDVCIFEKDAAWEDLKNALQIECDRRGVELNIFWRPPTTTPKHKIIRFKQQEALMSTKPTPRLTFVRGEWNEDVWREYSWQDGVRMSTTSEGRKDDRIDGISQALFAMQDPTHRTEESKLTKEAQEKFEEDQKRAAQYRAVFGSNDYARPDYRPQDVPRPAEDGNDEAYNPLLRVLSKGGFTKNSGKKTPAPPDKPAMLSFSSAPRVVSR
jgi:hypothetical protein